MLITINMSYLGVSKAILEGAGQAVEDEYAQLGMVTCYFFYNLWKLEGWEYYEKIHGWRKEWAFWNKVGSLGEQTQVVWLGGSRGEVLYAIIPSVSFFLSIKKNLGLAPNNPGSTTYWGILGTSSHL